MSIAYGANATDTQVHSDDRSVNVFVAGRCVLTFDHNAPDDAAYALIQLLTSEHGRSFDRID